MSTMIKMKIAIVFTICLTTSSSLFAQRVDDMLSKEEMNKEFDYLIELVSEVNPHLPIYKQMMGLDVIKEMKKQRKEINNIENWAEYYLFLSSMIDKIPEDHTRILNATDVAYNYYLQRYPFLLDSLVQVNYDKAYRDMDKMSEFEKKIRGAYKRYMINLTYIDGRFYSLHDVQIINNQTGSDQYVEAGCELTKINHIPVLELIKHSQFESFARKRYDIKNKALYNTDPTCGNKAFSIDFKSREVICNDMILTFLTPSGEEMVVKYADKHPNVKIIRNFLGFDAPEWDWIDEYQKEQDKVIYFDSVLYVKILAMNMDKLDFFREKIFSYRDVPLKKVVIDIRDNGGGDDDTWHGILSMIIDTTLYRRGTVAVMDSPLYAEAPYYMDMNFDSLNEYTDPYLRKKLKLLTGWCYGIEPDTNSLNYAGKIYLLHNRGSFSSSTAFLSCALDNEQIIAVGEHNGCLGGYAASPFVFQLPYSKLSFIMNASLQIPDNAKSVEDYFWNKTEVEVTTTPEWEVLMYLNKDFFTPEILKTKDPFFKKVMELR